MKLDSASPVFSIMIPTFNCAKYLRYTLESVLSQDLGEEYMQIEVIDDCSTLDNPQSIVDEIGKGRVTFFRQESNVGVTANFNTCIERSKGNYIHILHGDDYVNAGFYNSILKKLNEDNEVGIIITGSNIIDEFDNFLHSNNCNFSSDTLNKDFSEVYYLNPFNTPAVVVSKSVYKKVGNFHPELIHTSDWEMWIRAIANTKLIIINEPLASYRLFSTNDTSRLTKSAENLKDYVRLASILSNDYENFNKKRFLKMVAYKSYHQISTFKKLGDIESFRNNLTFLRKLFFKLEFKDQVIISLRLAKLALIS